MSEDVHGCLSLCLPCDGLTTHPGCYLHLYNGSVAAGTGFTPKNEVERNDGCKNYQLYKYPSSF